MVPLAGGVPLGNVGPSALCALGHRNLAYLQSAKRLNSHKSGWSFFFSYPITSPEKISLSSLKPSSLSPASSGPSPGTWKTKFARPSNNNQTQERDPLAVCTSLPPSDAR
ncbi:hypothetical protein ILYODFUR_017862 [Ilyodon furcidens]|uniref:Uncharacterized protein n=1 Tax=Ilyodon furcidens TaxID=33524 RepID=A0ABV0VHA3_9TELE